MKVSYNWLTEYINLTETPDEVSKLLTKIGLEVSHIEEKPLVKGGLQGLLLGQVLTCEKHPNADKLYCTQVSIGENQVLSIVCGAPNIRANQKVIVAPVGTKLEPYAGNGFKIKETKIRGVVSEGMICAPDEIGLSPEHEGILVINTDLLPGTPASKCLSIPTDFIITIDITPNRADACSHWGVARDLRALLNRPINMPQVAPLPTDMLPIPIRVQVEDIITCPRYSGVVIDGIEVQASPKWLQQRLQSIDIQPINNVVDITNFVMHELGQPLHAFDYDKLAGHQLQIRKSDKGDQLVTLDGANRNLTGEELVIRDQEGVVALAGVLGGKRASISNTTQRIFLESAYFDAKSVIETTQQQHLKTDASFRYERGTDPNLTVYALQRALYLIQQLAPKSTFSSLLDQYPQPLEHRPIKVHYSNIYRLIGQVIPPATIKSILQRLDITLTEEKDDGFIAVVPPYRVDVVREVDIIEEVLRIYGYDRIEHSGHVKNNFLAFLPKENLEKRAYELSLLLTAHGYYEILTNSLTSSNYTKLSTEAEANYVWIFNPLSERLNIMRKNLVFSGLEVIAHNINRQQKDLKLFELGKTYHKLADKYIEYQQLGIWITGNIEAPNWIRKPRLVNFQDLNTIIFQLLAKTGIQVSHLTNLQDDIFEAGVQMYADQKPFIKAGKVSQACLEKMGVKQPTFFAELDWDWMVNMPKALPKYQPISKFPAVKRDLSLVLDQAITFQQIKEVVYAQQEEFIQSMGVFDVYEGAALGAGKKAYALSFALQDPNRTLEEKTIHQIMQRLMHAFEKELGAIIRD
jgi:phenylalanyl-tRNA synthetase beta chain